MPDHLPDLSDRAGWRRLARRAESPGAPPDWKVHRPGVAVYAIGLAVFGALGVALLAIVLLGGAFLCPAVGAGLLLALALFCLVALVLAPRHYLFLTSEWLLVSRPLRSPLRIAWSEIVSIDFAAARNPRGTRETYGAVSIRLAGGRRVKIDEFEIDQLRIVHEDLLAYKGRYAKSGTSDEPTR